MVNVRVWMLSIALGLGIGLPAAAGPAKVGEPAPPFTLVTYSGQEVTSQQLRGRVVVLNYWATWCGPCRVELPELDAYIRRYGSGDVVVYAIEVSGVPRSKLGRLADALSFPMVSRLKGRGYGKIKGAVPTNYVIDRDGILRHAAPGAFNARSLDAIVTPLLRGAPRKSVAAGP